MTARARHAVDLAAAGALGLVVFAGAANSGNVAFLQRAAERGRGPLLILLLALALAAAAAVRREWRLRPAVAVTLAVLLLYFLDTTAWAVLPATTLKKLAALVGIVVIGAVIAGLAPARPAFARLVLDGLLVGIGMVVTAGFLLWLVDPSRAVQPATVEYAARFIGIGDNPDTAASLLALGMPLALARVLAPGSREARVLAGLLLVAIAAEVIASGSRGALIAGFPAMFAVVALSRFSRMTLAVGLVAVVAAFGVSAWITSLPGPLTHGPHTKTVEITHLPVNAEKIVPLDQEIGSPWWKSHTLHIAQRTLLGFGVRLRALRGGIHQGLGRPLLGTGFGAEEFVNRYYGYNSENPEDGYVGIFMQTGVLGLALFLAFVIVSLGPFARRSVRMRTGPGTAPFAAAGVVVAGLLLAVSQSFFHSAGNIDAVPFWLMLLLAGSVGLARA